MHNINVEAVQQTAAKAHEDPAALLQHVAFDGERQTSKGQPLFRATIPVPCRLEGRLPAAHGRHRLRAQPARYRPWGGMACYSMSYAEEAARQGIELRALRARTEAEVDLSCAPGVTDNPPAQRIDCYLEVDADAPRDELDELKGLADEHRPGVYCVRNLVNLTTHLVA